MNQKTLFEILRRNDDAAADGFPQNVPVATLMFEIFISLGVRKAIHSTTHWSRSKPTADEANIKETKYTKKDDISS